MRVGFAFVVLALGTLVLALSTEPRSSSDLIGRLVSPAMADRRVYLIRHQDVSSEGVGSIDGTIDGGGAIKGMRWYVNGSAAAVEFLELHGNMFSVKIGLPPARERWTVFAIASLGRAHFVPMQSPLFLSLPGPAARPESTSYTVAASEHAAASLDYAATVSGAGTSTAIALAGKPVLQWFSGAHIVLTGWAVDLTRVRSADAVLVGFDRSLFRATPGSDRPDVAKALKNAAYGRSGFTVTIPSTYVTPGLHQVTVYVLNNSKQILLTGSELKVAVSTM